MKKWISIKSSLPNVEAGKVKYFAVKFSDGTTDQLPYRNKPHKKILGFMTEKEVTHWR